MPTRLFSLATLAMLAAAASRLPAQRYHDADEDWLDRCREERNHGDDRERYCELRELALPASGRMLTVDARENGGIEVRGWDADSVLVHVRVQADAESMDDARDLAKQIAVRTANDVIRADGPEPGRHASWSVSYEVFVPRRSDLSLETHNGPVSVEGVKGRLEVTAVNGPVWLASVAGDVRARTDNGPLGVRLEGARWDGAGLDAETTNGPVSLTIPERYAAHLETGTVNGPMTIDFPVTIQGRISGRRIATDIGGGGPTVRVVTTNGPVIVKRR